MIKINLAKSGGGGAAAPASLGLSGDIIITNEDLQKHGLIRILILMIPPALLYLYQQSVLPDLISSRDQKAASLSQLQTYNSQMQKAVQEIKKFKEEEVKIQARINYIEKVSKNRLREIKVMELVQQVIPEKVWLSRMESKDGSLVITGMAMSDYEISTFMEGLTKSVFFLDVNLMSSSEQIFDGLNVKRFEISCMMERPTR